jgi:hypothetical protein
LLDTGLTVLLKTSSNDLILDFIQQYVCLRHVTAILGFPRPIGDLGSISPAFASKDPKSTKRQSSYFALLGSLRAKAARQSLVIWSIYYCLKGQL